MKIAHYSFIALALTLSSSAFAGSSSKAKIHCKAISPVFYFSDSQALESTDILVDLQSGKATVSSATPTPDEEAYTFEVMKHSTEGSVPAALNTKIFTTAAVANSYNSPRYLFLTGNNSDDTEYSIVVAYNPYGANGSETLAPGPSDFTSSITFTWMTDGTAGAQAVTDCTMNLVN